MAALGVAGGRSVGGMPARIHEDEVDVPPELVRRLLVEQHPQWADLPLEVAGEWGTDHAMYRLGDDLVVRLPRIGWAVKAVAAEQRWLPVLAPQLRGEIPEVVATGEPGEGYPWPWTVLTWIHGEHPPPVDWYGAERLAVQLAGFNRALAAIDTTGGRAAGVEPVRRLGPPGVP
jgi:aminoglycoside phosphotransferase (APT) family kinase protein